MRIGRRDRNEIHLAPVVLRGRETYVLSLESADALLADGITLSPEMSHGLEQHSRYAHRDRHPGGGGLVGIVRRGVAPIGRVCGQSVRWV